jgi:hypothetical protein
MFPFVITELLRQVTRAVTTARRGSWCCQRAARGPVSRDIWHGGPGTRPVRAYAGKLSYGAQRRSLRSALRPKPVAQGGGDSGAAEPSAPSDRLWRPGWERQVPDLWTDLRERAPSDRPEPRARSTATTGRGVSSAAPPNATRGESATAIAVRFTLIEPVPATVPVARVAWCRWAATSYRRFGTYDGIIGGCPFFRCRLSCTRARVRR